MVTSPIPQNHHLDKRAAKIAESIPVNAPDTLLCTKQAAALMGLSPSWLNQARSKGYGPPFVRLSPRKIVYRLGDIRLWLNDRHHHSTAEYRT